MRTQITAGAIIAIEPTQQVKDTFRKREFVIELEYEKYPQQIKFQVTQDRCDTLNDFKVGQVVNVKFNLRGRPFQNKEGNTVYFTNLEAWRIEAAGSVAVGDTDKTKSFEDVPF